MAKELRTFPSFDAAVDEFFAKVEEQKMRQAATAQEEAVKGKLVRIQRENEARLQVRCKNGKWREGRKQGRGKRHGTHIFRLSILDHRSWKPRKPAFWTRLD